MCVSPIQILNPNYRHDKSPIYKRSSWRYDCQSKYILVPCGHCKQCIALKQMDIVQRVQMESLNSFLFFSTLTYDNAHLPVLSTSTGFDIPYADIRHLQLMFKRLRIHNSFRRPFRYFAVSERGREKSRPHFHILWFLPILKGESYVDGLSLNSLLYREIKNHWCVNVGSDKSPIYEPLFTFKQRFIGGKLKTNYDTHFVVPSLTSEGVSSVAFYCCKYLLKQNPKERRLQQAFKLNLPEDEYEHSWDLVKSKSVRSSSFGFGGSHNHDDIISYLKSCVARSDRSLPYPCFFPPDMQGSSFPLSHFYKSCSEVYSPKDDLDFILDKDPHVSFDFSSEEYFAAERSLKRINSFVDSKDFSLDLEFLFDD